MIDIHLLDFPGMLLTDSTENRRDDCENDNPDNRTECEFHLVPKVKRSVFGNASGSCNSVAPPRRVCGELARRRGVRQGLS